MQSLDHPVWVSLSTVHVDLSLGGELARRYRPNVNRFASARDDDEAALQALARPVQPSDPVFVLQMPDIRIPPALLAIKEATGVQMVAHAPVAPPDEADDIVALSDRDAAQMLALATLTEPGPSLRHTHRMGRFFGIRIDGRLVAMAGERSGLYRGQRRLYASRFPRVGPGQAPVPARCGRHRGARRNSLPARVEKQRDRDRALLRAWFPVAMRRQRRVLERASDSLFESTIGDA